MFARSRFSQLDEAVVDGLSRPPGITDPGYNGGRATSALTRRNGRFCPPEPAPREKESLH
jgi:hypothetical protein